MARIEKVFPSAWGLNMLIVALPGGGTLVHSPTWIGDDTYARVEAYGVPRILFAPNHFHHLSLKRFAEKYPRAMVVAGEQAIPRITKKAGVTARPVGESTDLLPREAKWLPCEGTKTGETWLSLVESDGARTLLVSDAFFNVNRAVTGVMGVALRALRTTPGLSLGRTFQWFAIGNAAVYRTWALDVITREAPTRLWTSHGDIAEGSDLTERLLTLLHARLG